MQRRRFVSHHTCTQGQRSRVRYQHPSGRRPPAPPTLRTPQGDAHPADPSGRRPPSGPFRETPTLRTAQGDAHPAERGHLGRLYPWISFS
ncbi:hypothetical protein CesoFtcFv8_025165 [Champsocephalus esox]|uniref:Uncharacterized protein n=1 Tax=Champsocephalus esox TaxID=159716 RepID=A0AAN8GEI3_9TELE|nr:hypothetical protein CesoFtcFv8_025165 [Champsocephalus esox]